MFKLLYRGVGRVHQSKIKEYFRILEVNAKSSQQEMKSSFHRLAKVYHPDTGKQKNEQKFKELLEAYKYLSNPSNPREEGQAQSAGSQEQEKKETEDERLRRQTYDYFNNARKRARQEQEPRMDEGPLVYDSFLETMKAAPQLYFFTLFTVIVTFSWMFSAPKPKNRSYAQKIDDDEQQEYYRLRERQAETVKANRRAEHRYQQRHQISQ